jgi:catechol 2,3-dioxygenase-like lactoylglutathione lyase family enzyme
MTDFPSKLTRRDALKAGASIAPALLVGQAQAADPVRHQGWPLVPMEGSNPLAAKVIVFSVVSPDIDASIKFYTQVMGFELLDQGTVPAPVSTAPGAGQAGRRYVLIGSPKSARGATIRVLEAPPGAPEIRPRPGGNVPPANAWDPGLLVMEGGARDAAESYYALKSAATPMISPPRYYFFRANGSRRDLDVMSYAPFGPSGEQLFITINVRNDRPDWTEPGLHTPAGGFSLVSLDQRPVEEFYLKALGLRRTSQMDCHQRNCNELIGAPRDTYFLWGTLGDVSMEIWEFKMPEGTMYPCSLDKTGLAMVTMQVNDLDKCRAMCKTNGIEPVGEGAFPRPGVIRSDGFTLRGAVGELIEVVQA